MKNENILCDIVVTICGAIVAIILICTIKSCVIEKEAFNYALETKKIEARCPTPSSTPTMKVEVEVQ